MTNHPVTADQHAHLVDLIDRGKGILLQLERMIEYQFKRAETTDGQFRVSRHKWLRAKLVVERLRQALRGIRQNIQSHMSSISLYVKRYYRSYRSCATFKIQ